MQASRRLALALLCTSVALPAGAHLMPMGNAAVRIVDNDAYLTLAVPVQALQGWDTDADGRMNATELAQHRDVLLHQLRQRVVLRAGNLPPAVIFEDLLFEADEPGAALTAQLTLLRRVRWAKVPNTLAVRSEVFDPARQPQLLIRGYYGADARTDTALLSPTEPERVLFRGAWANFTQFVTLGFEHIVTGYDHLLFLLALLLTASGWRYWVSVISSFTVAHSLTLAAGVLGYVRVAPAIVEPGILASVFFMAALALWRRRRHRPLAALRAPRALVFACGLLHGLGFASALNEIGVYGGSLIANLVGFNVGVELGQLSFVLCSLLLLQLATVIVHAAPKWLRIARQMRPRHPAAQVESASATSQATSPAAR